MSLVEEILEKLVGFDTVSDKSNLEIISYIKDFCSARGAKIDLIPNMNGDKCGLVARFGPAEPGGVLLSGHTDVVPIDGQNWTGINAALLRGLALLKLVVCFCLAIRMSFQLKDKTGRARLLP